MSIEKAFEKEYSGSCVECEIELSKDGDEYEIYINGWYLTNVKPEHMSDEVKRELMQH